MSSVLLVLLVLQSPGGETGRARPLASLEQEMMYRWLDPAYKQAADAVALRAEAEQQERIFVSQFNKFLRAVADFASHYNSAHAINVRKLTEVKKAWQALERTEPWLRPRPGPTGGKANHSALHGAGDEATDVPLQLPQRP